MALARYFPTEMIVADVQGERLLRWSSRKVSPKVVRVCYANEMLGKSVRLKCERPRRTPAGFFPAGRPIGFLSFFLRWPMELQSFTLPKEIDKSEGSFMSWLYKNTLHFSYLKPNVCLESYQTGIR